MNSIQSRLRRKLLTAIAGTSTALLIVVAIFGGSEFREANERSLTQFAYLVLGLSGSLNSTGVEPLMDPEIYERLDVGDYLVIVSRDGREIYASPNLVDVTARPTRDADQFRTPRGGFDLLHVSDAQSNTFVTVGLVTEEVAESLIEIALVTMTCFLISALVLWRFSLTAIRSALLPLHLFAEETRRRHSGNLIPLDVGKIPEEMTDVATALNGLMDKLEIALNQERRFVSNAAHELRTPLAGIVAQIDSISATPDIHETADALIKVKTAAIRSNRMVSQLLSHARAVTLQDDEAIASRFDVRALVQEIIANCTQSAIEAGVDLGVDFCIPEKDAETLVDYPRDLLQIVIENLVDNAVKYCGRPGIVTVSLSKADPSELLLCVDDNGPGLFNTNFTAATARFERMGNQTKDGYGLGLSLVADLTKRLDIPLESGQSSLGGLGVTLKLSKAPIAGRPI